MFPTAGMKKYEIFRPYRGLIRGPLSKDRVQEATHYITVNFQRCDAFNARGNISNVAILGRSIFEI
jgi:hypothetical protein